jgi:hypothetical protein
MQLTAKHRISSHDEMVAISALSLDSDAVSRYLSQGWKTRKGSSARGTEWIGATPVSQSSSLSKSLGS